MDESKESATNAPSTADRLEAAVERLKEALAVLDDAGVPLACAYVDLALSLCREELVRRSANGS